MFRRNPVLAALSVLMLLSVLGVASGQFPQSVSRRPPPVPEGPGPVPQEDQSKYVPRVGPPPDFSLKVYHDFRIPESKVAEYPELRDKLDQARIGVPNDRVGYFLSINRSKYDDIYGWSGLIDSIKKFKGGVIVNLRVFARRGGITETANIIEQCSLVNGKFTYLGFFVPNDLPRVQIGM